MRNPSVQMYRHDARDALTRAREALALKDLTRNEHTLEVYNLLNGSIGEVLAGRPGYSQEEQVERLDTALSRVTENREKVEAALSEAKDLIREQIEEALAGWDETVLGETDAAIHVLTEAKDFAATRDFDAWQAAKRESASYEDDEDDEDDEATDEDEEF